MSFPQQLARTTATAREKLRRSEELKRQQVLQTWLSKIKEEFVAQCEKTALDGMCSCTILVDKPDEFGEDFLMERLRSILGELCFQDGTVARLEHGKHKSHFFAKMTGRWKAEDATATSSEPILTGSGGACATCPICHDQRPAVVLVPCGHVVCQDCHRDHELKKCPMCREVTTSATRGLFMS